MIRFLDIVLALLILVVTGLPMLVVAVAIYAHDGFPVVFQQIRVGRNGRPFTIFKFRSMRLAPPESSSGAVTGTSRDEAVQARAAFQTTQANDPRITPVGRVIRKSHLDELPQLFNVLRGDMSLVGVRPDTPAQEVDYTEDYWRRRHSLRPGITGLAQVMNTQADGMDGRRHWETVWIERHSLLLYLSVLFRTVVKVLKRNSF
ncbi:sugar transferase [Roseovarius sp. ZX-A-9]|uniref:sugar transferase n=1 Tax=Roseovarius sp. ZX-A-9 TaxID=3014783 RepID=UPI00232F81FF|nr:sugar transferase [Roseovarius sp. ZX-A-9]